MKRRQWIDIGSDVNWIDHGGLWALQISDRQYFVLEFTNAADWGETGYYVQLSRVDLDNPQLPKALENHDCSEDASALVLVYALHSYGATARLFNESGTSSKSLMRAAKRVAFRLQRDAQELAARLGTSVNALGSTAEEYERGDILSGTLRGVAAGDPTAELMLKLGVR